MLHKLFICPFFGPLPHWMPKYIDHLGHLKNHGYDFLITHDLEDFNERCEKKLGFKSTIVPGTGKLWDYRCALGELYEEEIKGYDFWGHTDFDCVYGDVSKWVTDEFLGELDIHSNHHSYICGPWTLYRNTPHINSLFRKSPVWKERMLETKPSGWVEFEFSRTVESYPRYKYTYWQGIDPQDTSSITFDGTRLFDHGTEVMMVHFNRNKVWPL